MTDRSAVDAIRGYFYQFDLSILSVLRLPNPDDSIAIECVEDIDIRTATEATAIQCKYYGKTEYNHSVIKEAVMCMLSHFKEVKSGTKPRVSYVIRGHYASGQEKLDGTIDVEFLKRHFLTYTSDKVKRSHQLELGLDDTNLAEFLSLLRLDIRAEAFDTQFQQIISQFQVIFGGTLFSAEFFHYNNALAIIRKLAIEPSPEGRTITKKAFLAKVNTASVLFNEWFVRRRGKREHLAAVRKEYFSDLNVSPFERFFLVEINPASYVRDELKDLLFALSRKWSKVSRREPKPFCPYVFVHGIADEELLALKKDIYAEGFKFVDGYDFHGADFSADSIAQRPTASNGVKIKILNSPDNLTSTIAAVAGTRKIYQFHLGESYFEVANNSIGHIKIQVEGLSDIKAII